MTPRWLFGSVLLTRFSTRKEGAIVTLPTPNVGINIGLHDSDGYIHGVITVFAPHRKTATASIALPLEIVEAVYAGIDAVVESQRPRKRRASAMAIQVGAQS